MNYNLSGIELLLHLGTTPAEQNTLQSVLVDVTFTADHTTAATSDALADGVDYNEVYEVVKGFSAPKSTTPRVMLERLHKEIYEAILKLNLPITELSVTLHKTPYEDALVTVSA